MMMCKALKVCVTTAALLVAATVSAYQLGSRGVCFWGVADSPVPPTPVRDGVTFYLEGVTAGMTLLGTTGKVMSSSDPAIIDWGDGSTSTIAYSSTMKIPAHTYTAAGNYEINISCPTLTGIGSQFTGSVASSPIFTKKAGIPGDYLKRVTFGSDVQITSLGTHTFRSHIGLREIKIPEGVTSIGTLLLSGCTSLESIVIPDKVVSIGQAAFSATAIKSLYIPKSVTSIYSTNYHNQWVNCSNLVSIVVDEANTKYDSRNNCNAIIRKSDKYLITGCQNTVIPDTVLGLESQCFSGCAKLNSITIPSSVTKINSSAFYGCTELTSVTIPNSVTTIPNGCFSGCIRLVSITIPSSVTSVGDSAFAKCTGLTSITSNRATPPTASANTFTNVPTDIPVYVPADSISAYQAATGWSQFTNYQPLPE